MAEPEAKPITKGPTPEPPQDASDVAKQIQHDAKDKPIPDKVKAPLTELDREVSGAYEAKQERDLAAQDDAATDPRTAPPRQPGD